MKVFFSLFLSILFFHTNAIAGPLKLFSNDDVERARHFAKHVYRVSEECRDNDIDGEDRGNIAAEDGVHTIPGRTGAAPLGIEIYWSGILGAVYLRENKVYVAFRGTSPYVDWLTNFNALLRPAEGIHGFNGKLHRGFSEAARSCYVSMVNQIRNALGDRRVEDLEFIFTGHSLGGAIATINAFQFMHTRGRSGSVRDELALLPEGFNNAKLVTFSSPPVGDETFADAFRTSLPKTLRFFHTVDIVANLPINYHVGYPLQIVPFEVTVALLATDHGRGIIREQFNMRETTLGRWAHRAVYWLPVDFQKCSRAIAYGIDGVSRIAPGLINLMHLVPEEDVVLRAFRYGKTFEGDWDHKGTSIFDPGRNPITGWLYSLI